MTFLVNIGHLLVLKINHSLASLMEMAKQSATQTLNQKVKNILVYLVLFLVMMEQLMLRSKT